MLLSIIFILSHDKNYNLKSCKNILEQNHFDYEIIAINNSNQTSCRKLLAENQKKLDLIIENPELSTPEMMNFAVSNARGEFCLFVRSGSTINLSSIPIKLLTKDCDLCISNFRVQVINFFKYIYRIPQQKDAEFLYISEYPMETVIFRREKIISAGKINTKYKFEYFYELILRMIYRFHYKLIFTKKVFSTVRLGKSDYHEKIWAFQKYFDKNYINKLEKMIFITKLVRVYLKNLFLFLKSFLWESLKK